jgi:hypothetical protein
MEKETTIWYEKIEQILSKEFSYFLGKAGSKLSTRSELYSKIFQAMNMKDKAKRNCLMSQVVYFLREKLYT